MNETHLTTAEIPLTLTRDERAYLERVLQNALGDTRVEAHRTHSPQFRERVLNEEELVRGLLSKLEKSA